MRKGRFLILLALLSMVSMAIGSAPAQAATPKVGAACTKVGAKYGTLVCAKVNGKLKWIVAKKAQIITYSAPKQSSVDIKNLSFAAQSSSKLVVAAKSLTPTVCSAASGNLEILGVPGKCSIQLSQAGSATFLAAPSIVFEVLILGINVIDFQLPGALLLKQGSYELSATGSSAEPIVFVSQTSDVCSISGTTLILQTIGKCTVTANQSADSFFPAAKEVSKTVEVSADRVTADLPDTVSGFQVKAIYVVPSDGVDHAYDTNGILKMVLDDGTAYLRQQLGLEIPIDSTSSGYDISFMRSSKSSQYFLSTTGSYSEMLKESKVLDAPGANRKNYIFFVDTDTIIDSGYCGEAPRPGLVAVVAIGLAECGKQTNSFDNYASQTWVHELFHNFGVSHVPDSCDLMTSGQTADGPACPAGQLHTIDAKRNLYFGTDANGADISRLRVWKGYTGNPDLIADCLVTPTNQAGADGLQFAYCPTGLQTIGAASYCWTNVTSVSLEQLVNGSWVSVGVGNTAVRPWGSKVDWKCGTAGYTAPTIQISVATPGIAHYRWVINGDVAEEMNVIWVL